MVMSAVSFTDGSPMGLSPVLPVSSPGERHGDGKPHELGDHHDFNAGQGRRPRHIDRHNAE
jgi:hypothetical protein